MRFQDLFNSPPSGRGYAMALMLFGSIVISFSGLLIRNISSADTWEINFYRSLAFGFIISILLTFKYGKSAPQQVKLLGPSKILAAVLMALAGITFLQAINNTTVAATTFTLCVIPFLTAVMARLFLGERVKVYNAYNGGSHTWDIANVCPGRWYWILLRQRYGISLCHGIFRICNCGPSK